VSPATAQSRLPVVRQPSSSVEKTSIGLRQQKKKGKTCEAVRAGKDLKK